MTLRRGYLPTGFKESDWGHLSEGSYCFCAHCRVRFYPRRTEAEKIAAALIPPMELPIIAETSQSINVDELELTSVSIEDITADGVKLEAQEDGFAEEEESEE